jgi:hypothetical protein
MLMPTSTLAIVGIGNASTNAKSIVPQSSFFILQPPLYINVLSLPEPFLLPTTSSAMPSIGK